MKAVRKYMKIDTSITLAGVKLRNPVLTASGTFGYGDELIDIVPPEKLGGIITKTITLHPRPGNPPPRLCEVTAGILNTIGLQNVGVDRFLDEKWDVLKKLPVPVIVSIAGESAEDYIGVARRLNEVKGIAAIELNLSCPNLQKKIVCLDTALVAAVIKGVSGAIRVPVFAKISPMVQDLPGLAGVIEKSGADAISLVNTFPGMAIDLKTWKPKLAVVSGGMSGPAIKPLALRCVWQVACSTKLPVIGGGGIMSGGDAVEFMLAGATAVSVGTASFADPLKPVTIAEEIGEYLRSRDLRTVKAITGKLRV